jgi:hypothetical protein
MQLTTEQERAVMRGAERHQDNINQAMHHARRAIFSACSRCWYNRAAVGCRGRDCPVARIAAEINKCNRMLQRGKLTPNWYIESKHAATLAEVPFLAAKEGSK